ncbi:FtsX-like permease family protein [Nocardiopsis sp. RSe5-2]|uniref:FtsX-like permease family protein n=1 Tax=Nocardiopsis endophytica TaxID=3018445 RepID=A0ABT4U5E8_9ACTN|nr:FtsX-like permease family protein [Nocardiopsis endophytica]MDA2812168.1 FtsX-like permease family protein [Nocardiopsis endophytica]
MPVWRTTLAGLRAHKARLAMAALATVLGVAFTAGTLVLGDTLRADAERTVTANTADVDVAVLATSGLRELPQEAVDELAALDGVERAQGAVEGQATLLGADGRPLRQKPVAASVTLRTSLAEGRAPGADDEVALAASTAEDAGAAVGDTVGVLDARGRQRDMTVTGLVDTRGEGTMALRGAAVFTLPSAKAVTGKAGYAGIYVTSSGPAPEDLRADVAAAVGEGGREVLTGREWADAKAAGSGVDPALLSAGLAVLALVSLLVSGLVIGNTFGILVAQRKRELALLRCVGASRSQVFGGVLAESAALGAAASVLGAAAGVGAGYAAVPLLRAFGSDIPFSVVTVTPQTLAISLAAGLAVTVGAAALPAHAATRVPPVAALNSTREREGGRFGSVRGVLGLSAAATGAGATAAAVPVLGAGPTALTTVVAGGMVLFLGLVALGPVLVRPAVAVVGFLPRRLFGTPGRLAVANARRNPRRAATTAVALAVGVTLMSGVSVATESFSASVGKGVEHALPVDFIVTAPGTAEQAQIPPEVVERLQGTDGIAEIGAQREAVVELDGKEAGLASVVPGGPFEEPVVVAGVDPEQMGRGQVAVTPERAEEFGLGVGDTVSAATGDGRTVDLEVAAIVRASPYPPFSMAPEAFTALFGERGYGALMINTDPGLSPEEGRAAVEAGTEDHPAVSITGTDDARRQLEATLSNLVMIVGGLLALSVLVSLVGIANTMSLSVVERTRESALLRALGVTRRQLGRMLTVEALVLGAVGACTGAVVGGVYGLAAITAMRADAVPAVPVGQLAVIVVGSGLAAMAAAALPARRAGRTSIAASLAGE